MSTYKVRTIVNEYDNTAIKVKETATTFYYNDLEMALLRYRHECTIHKFFITNYCSYKAYIILEKSDNNIAYTIESSVYGLE